MKLIVKNFGPIREGEVDLNKRIYVFVGYNNSGKTYIKQLLWSIFDASIGSGSEYNLFEEALHVDSRC